MKREADGLGTAMNWMAVVLLVLFILECIHEWNAGATMFQ